jgi:thymidylate kinase
MVERLNAFAVGDCVPDITFVLDVDASTAESRMQRSRAGRIEWNSSLLSFMSAFGEDIATWQRANPIALY